MATSSNSQHIQNWINHNKELLRSYKGEWIAYDETGFLTSAKTLDQVCQQAELVSKNYLVYFVDPYRYGKINFRPIHFRSVSFHDWAPLYPIQIEFGASSIQLPMLIDSGADGSLISMDTGLKLGLQTAPGETIQEAKGIGGGRIGYVWRNLQVTINNHTITAPFAWTLEGENQENIIGRQVVFDEFDIEFKQADEQIIFTKRNSA